MKIIDFFCPPNARIYSFKKALKNKKIENLNPMEIPDTDLVEKPSIDMIIDKINEIIEVLNERSNR